VDSSNAKKIVNHIFDKLSLIYGNAFTSLLDNRDWERVLRGQWESAIMGMEIEDVVKAIKFLSSKENSLYPTYPPTFVQFSLLGSQIKRKEHPGVREAFLSATKQNFVDPVVYATAQEVGIDFICLNPNKAYPFFAEIYERNIDKYLKGTYFPPQPPFGKEKIYLNTVHEITLMGRFQAAIARYLLNIETENPTELDHIARITASEIAAIPKNALNRLKIIAEITNKYYQYIPSEDK
jgi:hypothetical protein